MSMHLCSEQFLINPFLNCSGGERFWSRNSLKSARYRVVFIFSPNYSV